ncbi:MAG: hypothetical protein ACRCSE_01730 [Vibrio sp.]
MRVRDYIPSIFALATMLAVGAGDATGLVVTGLFLLALFALPITSRLINKARENIGLKPRGGMFYFAVNALIYSILITLHGVSGVQYDKYKENTIEQIKRKPLSLRHDLVNAYMSSNKINVSDSESFYSCFSHMLNTKGNQVTMDRMLGWCKDDHVIGRDQPRTYINFDEFEKNINQWDGSYRPLEAAIKADMHDKNSYKHSYTRYRYVLDDTPIAVVMSEFTGINAYGATVKQTVRAQVSLPNGLIVNGSVNYSGM